MNFEILIPLALFVCIAYVIRVVVEARLRGKIVAANGSEELVRSMLQGEEQQRRHASLRWGVILVALAIGFVVIEAFGWREITPGVVAVLLGVTGIGNLAFYAISRQQGR